MEQPQQEEQEAHGYYGGAGGSHLSGSCAAGGGGGSSFISGHNGCDAISGESTETNIVHTGQSVHYSGYKFSNTVMKAGNEEMPNQDKTGTMIGNTNNGYALIQYLGNQKMEKVCKIHTFFQLFKVFSS